MLKFAALLVPALVNASAEAGPASLCASSEKVFFSCVAHNKLVSVCGAIESSNVWLQYRAGIAGQKPEFVFPEAQASPNVHFRSGARSQSAKGSIWNLAFESNGREYTIYRFRHSFEPMAAGVVIKEPKGRTKYLRCQERTVVDNLPDIDALALPRIETNAIVVGPE